MKYHIYLRKDSQGYYLCANVNKSKMRHLTRKAGYVEIELDKTSGNCLVNTVIYKNKK